MSEPRKINTSGSHASGQPRSIHTGAASGYSDQRLEEARARARADAEAARLRRSQQFQRIRQTPPSVSGTQVRRLDLNRTQGTRPAYDLHNDADYQARQQQRMAAQAAGRPLNTPRPAAQPAAARQVSQPAARPAAQPAAARPTSQQADAPVHASAPRQIHRAGSTAGTGGRTIHRSQPAQQTTRPVQQPRQTVTPHPDVARAAAMARSDGRIHFESDPGSATGRGGGAGGGKPPRNGGQSGRSASPRDRKKRKKTKGLWWKILLGTLLAIVLIFAGTVGVIMSAIRPESGGISISDLLNTPEGLDGQQLNIMVVGIDRSSEGGDMAAGSVSDGETNDGHTDMIMYVQLDFVNNEVRMLQIPRNIMVTTDYSVSNNYQINDVALAQGSNGNNNYAALAQVLNEQFGLYVDGYVAIRLEALVQLVDYLGPIQVFVPEEITYTDGNGNVTSHLDQGLQWMDGATAEFFLRARKTYAQSDIQRLNVQRFFYAAMFARLRAMNVWDVAKILPVVMTYMETDLPVSQLVSAAVSLLSVSSDHIMLCQVPVYMGGLYYQSNDICVVARDQTADLLNSYFRTPETQIPAEQLGVCDDVVDVGNRTPTDPNVQYMGGLNEQVVDSAQQDGVSIAPDATYDLPPEATAQPEDSSAAEDSSAEQPTE